MAKVFYFVCKMKSFVVDNDCAFGNLPDDINNELLEHIQVLLSSDKSALSKERTFTKKIEKLDVFSFLCYFCFLVDPSDENISYLVCLLVESEDETKDEILETMTMEVNDYVVDNIGSLLYQQNIDEVKGKLENWYSNSIDFMNRCISFLDKSLPQYLHASLLGNSFQFNEDTSLTHALNKMGNIIQVMRPSGNIEPISFTKQEDNSYSINYSDCNSFCEEWAKTLNDVKSNPSAVKEKLDQYRFSIGKRLNDIRRMLDNARFHNHDLYRSYDMISSNSNKDIILAILSQEIETNTQLSTVISSILEFSKQVDCKA